MKMPAKSVTERWADIRALDKIAIPLVPTLGIQPAYKLALVEVRRADLTTPARRSGAE